MRKLLVGLGIAGLLLSAQVFAAPAADSKPKSTERNVTFLSTSDSHYAAIKNEDRNVRDLDTVRAMNAVTDLTWPDELGGGRVDTPRGVIVLGDNIDDGDMKSGDINVSEKQYAAFVKDFGLDGKDGLLRYPVFEGWGNHDGPPVGKEKVFSSQTHLKERTALRKEKGLISNISDAGVHYSWDWDDVHFVQLGIYPADKQREGIRYSPVWHDPQGALTFLKKDLEQNVGKSGRPVVLMAHMGMDTDWWVKEDWKEFYDAVKGYNVAVYVFGHSGTGVSQWAPAGETKKLLLLNDGQTENGFFIVQLKGKELRLAQRVKDWKIVKGADGKETRTWNGVWKWDWMKKVDLTTPKTN